MTHGGRLSSLYSVLSGRLLHDRELDLYDGTRLLRWDRYQALKEQLQFSDQQLQERCAQTQTRRLAAEKVDPLGFYQHFRNLLAANV